MAPTQGRLSPFWMKGSLRTEFLVEPCCLTRDDEMSRPPLYQDTLPSLWSVTHLSFDVYQIGLKTGSSLLLGGFSKITASRYDCNQHRVHSVLRNRLPPFSHPHILASGLVAGGHRHVHDLDRTWLSHLLRELHYMERECHQLGTSLVRYQYAHAPSLDPYL